MGGGAHAADALHDLGGVARMTPRRMDSKPRYMPPVSFCIDDFAVFNHDLGLEMAFVRVTGSMADSWFSSG